MKKYLFVLCILSSLGGMALAQITPIIQKRMSLDLAHIKILQIQLNFAKNEYLELNSELNAAETVDNMSNQTGTSTSTGTGT